jgi:hypothetical protein
MIVIGADTHKGSHALSAVEGGTGRVRGSRQIKADGSGHLAAVRWARGLDEERVWAIEDCRACSRRFEQALVAAGERVVRVPPHRMGESRKGEREPGKSDEIDAQAVARAVVKDGVEKFPVAYLNERAMEIRLLFDHRRSRRRPDSDGEPAAWSTVLQPGPLHAFYERTKARRGHGKAIVATARKLSVLFWCMLTRSEDYAHQQPTLTNKKLRRLELTAGAPKNTRKAAGVWSTNVMMRDAERALAQQAETSYKRMVQDQLAGGPARKVGASVTVEHA